MDDILVVAKIEKEILKYAQTNLKRKILTIQEAAETNPKPNSHKYTPHHPNLPCIMASIVEQVCD